MAIKQVDGMREGACGYKGRPAREKAPRNVLTSGLCKIAAQIKNVDIKMCNFRVLCMLKCVTTFVMDL